MNLDLDKVQVAMDWLADTPGGDAALKTLSDACDAVRAKLPADLNNAEMRYILERLMSQRSLAGWDKKLEPAEVAGYNLQSLGAFFPQQTGISHASLPQSLNQEFRVLNYGFNVKFSIPATRF